MVNWYDKVSKDISTIPDAVKHFESELLEAKRETNIKGRIELASATMPAIVGIVAIEIPAAIRRGLLVP